MFVLREQVELAFVTIQYLAKECYCKRIVVNVNEYGKHFHTMDMDKKFKEADDHLFIYKCE